MTTAALGHLDRLRVASLPVRAEDLITSALPALWASLDSSPWLPWSAALSVGRLERSSREANESAIRRADLTKTDRARRRAPLEAPEATAAAAGS